MFLSWNMLTQLSNILFPVVFSRLAYSERKVADYRSRIAALGSKWETITGFTNDELERDPSAAAKRFKGELRATRVKREIYFCIVGEDAWNHLKPIISKLLNLNCKNHSISQHFSCPSQLIAADAKATQSEIFNQRMTIRRQKTQWRQIWLRYLNSAGGVLCPF